MTTAPTAPAICHFDIVNWDVMDSFTRVMVRGPHELTNRLLQVPGAAARLTWDDAHALAASAWMTDQPQDQRGVSVEPSWR